MKKRLRPEFDASTEASAENRDSRGRPLPKLPRVSIVPPKMPPYLAWDRMLARGRRHASAASISSLLRFRRLTFAAPMMTAPRERVLQFRGLGLAIRAAGGFAWIGLGVGYGLIGVAAGAPIAAACFVIGRAKSKPWRCGHCKTPLATAKVRVCPGCGARLVDLGVGKVIPESRQPL